MKDKYLNRFTKPDYPPRGNQVEADKLRGRARDLERKADNLNIQKAERNRIYMGALQIRVCAYRMVAKESALI